MKKIVALLLALVMIACCFTAFVSAKEADVVATIGSAKVLRGKEVTVNITLKEVTEKLGYTGGSIVLDAIPAGLTLKEGKWTLATNQDGVNMINFNKSKLEGVFALDTKVDLPSVDAQYGDIFTMTFEVADNCTFGDKTIAAELTLKNGKDELGIIIEFGTITVYCDHVGALALEYDWDETNHWSVCEICEGKIDTTVVAHEFDNDCDTECNTCDYTRVATHDFDAQVWETDETNHWNVCSKCEDELNKDEHQYSSDCDTTCNVCGYERETTVDHNVSATDWSIDDNNHWKVCPDCDAIVGKVAHVYDNACDMVCNDCEYERTVGAHNVDTDDWKYGAEGHDGHYNICKECQEIVNEFDHEYDNACDTTCNVCGYVRTVGDHDYIAEMWEMNDTEHWNICDECGAEVNKAVHVYDNACDAICNVCEYERTVGDHVYDDICDPTCNECGEEREPIHAFPETYESDETEHWIECTNCKSEKADTRAGHVFDQEVVDEAYLVSAATCVDKAVYNYSCVCGKKGTGTFEYGEPTNEHTYDETEYDVNEDTHWNVCSVCFGKFNEAAHEYDNACDTDCNVCGKSRVIIHDYDMVEWKHDECHHWHECTVCGDQTDIGVHVFDENDICEGCGCKKYVTGDLDGDEEVTVDDATYILYSIFFPEDYPVNQSCDFDGDEDVDVDDATYLLYNIFFPEDYPLEHLTK